MNKQKILTIAFAAVLLLTQCKKSGENVSQREENSHNAKQKSQTSAVMCADCAEAATKVTTSQAATWANKFAPLLKFDRAAPDYPTSVENIWSSTNPSSIVCGGKLVLTNNTPPSTIDFPTYYDVIANPNDANKVYIEYWWAYKRQGNCIGSTGGHDYDWEHMVVQINKATEKVISVTYFQHAGWYTKDWRSVASGTQIVGYVGKVQHGMYHFSRSTSLPGYQCTYWGDYRNPNGTKDEFLTSKNLVRMNCSITQFSYNGDWGNVGKGPMYRNRNYWSFASCKGTDGLTGTDGCAECDFGAGVLIGSY